MNEKTEWIRQLANMKSELQKMWQTVTAWATAGEQNSKWWLTPTNKYYERSEYLEGVLGGRCNHDWGMTERGEQNKLTRHDEHLLERRSECGSVRHKGRRKNTTWKVEIFLGCLFTLVAMFLRTKWTNDEDRFTCVVLWVDFLYFLKFPISYKVKNGEFSKSFSACLYFNYNKWSTKCICVY